MTQNNNFSVLPFYDSKELWNSRKSYAYGRVYPLYVSTKMLIPFQIVRKSKGTGILFVKLFREDGTLVAEVTQQMIEAGLTIKRRVGNGYDSIVFPARLPLATTLTKGQYYLVLSDGSSQWWSEIFTAVDNVEQYLKIEWWDLEDSVFDAGCIAYISPLFHNIVYLCTEIGKPEYKFEEDGEERDGYFFPEKQISKKLFNFKALAPEYLCDAMRFIRMSDMVIVTDHLGRTYNCDTFLMTPKWQGDGDIASIECQFATDTVVKKLANGYSLEKKGDFNRDYNNDYYIKK